VRKPIVARAGSALVGATKGLFGCIIQGGYGGQIGAAIMLMASPVCAIAGGIDGARDRIWVPLGRDVSEIFGKSLEGSAIQAWIRDDILRASEARNGHPLTFVPALEPAAGASASDSLLPSFPTLNAKLIVTIKRVMLYDASKSREADPARPLVVEAEAVLHNAQNDEHIASIQVVHHGEQHPLSRWLADDAAQLKESLRSASRILGERIYGQIGNRSSKR